MICGAMALVAAVVCVFTAHRDKPVVSPEPVTAQTVLVIDAGHGGEDGGAVSASGVPESTINLAIAQKTQLLLAFVGQVTIMTREGEEAIYSPDAQTLREKKVSDAAQRRPGEFLPNDKLLRLSARVCLHHGLERSADAGSAPVGGGGA